ncbi:FAD:protein FMN transferase [Thermodesulfovibrionales bacterium]|nr:FAD:protein FMN transferase [Thermodesulfovibrionales bacterium]
MTIKRQIFGRKVFSLFILFIGCLLLFSCSPTVERLYEESRMVMGTVTSITVVSDSETRAKTAIGNAFKEMERLEGLLNYFCDYSEVTMINKNAGIEPVVVSGETLEVIERAIYVSKKTDGSFDITMGPVISLWDFRNGVIPDGEVIKEKLRLVGYENIIINREESTVFLKKSGVEINLGGIAKGFAADKAVDTLKNHGIAAGLASVGGDIRAFGTRPGGEPWRIGIENPRPTSVRDRIIAVVDVSDMAISTSGDYHRFFIKNDRRYHHLIDPRTGFPACGLQSVTVIARYGVFTDAFATAIFILGLQKGMDVLSELEFDGVMVDKHGEIHITEGVKEKIEFMDGG